MHNYPEKPFVFEFDLATYRLSAVKKAAYRFSGHFAVSIEPVSEDRIQVSLSPLGPPILAAPDPRSFPSEVLDQELRKIVAEDTKSVRDLILAHAFFGRSMADPVGETADYRQDPLGIASLDRGVSEAGRQ